VGGAGARHGPKALSARSAAQERRDATRARVGGWGDGVSPPIVLVRCVSRCAAPRPPRRRESTARHACAWAPQGPPRARHPPRNDGDVGAETLRGWLPAFTASTLNSKSCLDGGTWINAPVRHGDDDGGSHTCGPPTDAFDDGSKAVEGCPKPYSRRASRCGGGGRRAARGHRSQARGPRRVIQSGGLPPRHALSTARGRARRCHVGSGCGSVAGGGGRGLARAPSRAAGGFWDTTTGDGTALPGSGAGEIGRSRFQNKGSGPCLRELTCWGYLMWGMHNFGASRSTVRFCGFKLPGRQVYSAFSL